LLDNQTHLQYIAVDLRNLKETKEEKVIIFSLLANLLQMPLKTSLTSKDRSIRTVYCLKKEAANPVIGNSDCIIELQEIGDEYSI
jgi:hypothetical protein